MCFNIFHIYSTNYGIIFGSQVRQILHSLERTSPLMNQTPHAPLSFDEAIMKCTNMLQSKNNPEQSLVSLLQILGNYYHADFSYIFEWNEEKDLFENNYHWSGQEANEVSEAFLDLPITVLEKFSTERFKEQEIEIMTYERRDNSEAFFETMDSIIASVLKVKGKIVGFVALTNVVFENFDSRLFGCALLFIEECLQKREMYLQLALLHNLDPLTGFFNSTKYAQKLKQLEQACPEKTGVVTIEITDLTEAGQVFGAKYVDVKIKNASLLMSQFLEFPIYRIEKEKFICFVTEVAEESFEYLMDQMRLETKTNSEACFVFGYSWFCGDFNISDALLRSQNNLDEKISNGFFH